MQNWWKDIVIYQIYPRSFNDSNDDGIGDIPGIIEKLGYLKDLGIGAIWLSPVYKSPNEDNGYDISDYTDINPEYGTMYDMDRLISEANRHGIKIIMDLVINHTSIEHEWFEKSRECIAPYKDYYIWRKGKGKKPPNNWTGFFGGDCWEYDEKRGEYYLHLFAKGQPDLNYYNPKVLEEVKNIMNFWLKKGVGGFRCDVVNILYKTSLENGMKSIVLTGKEHYVSQEGTHQILKTLRTEVLDNYNCFTVGETVLATQKTGKELCDKNRGELDMIFTFEHMEIDQFFIKWFPKRFRPKKFFKAIIKWQKSLEWSANYLENHDQPRSVSRFGDEEFYHELSAKMLAAMLLTLKGTPFIYQGQEIGMTNFDFTNLNEVKDIETHNIMKLADKLHIPEWYKLKMIKRGCRDNARTPMQWNDGDNAGFSDGIPWLKVNENYKKINAEGQMGKDNSIRNYYKKLINLRSKSNVLKSGVMKPVKMTKKIFVYERIYEDQKWTIALNFTAKEAKMQYFGNVILSNYENSNKNKLRAYEAIIIDGRISSDNF